MSVIEKKKGNNILDCWESGRFQNATRKSVSLCFEALKSLPKLEEAPKKLPRKICHSRFKYAAGAQKLLVV